MEEVEDSGNGRKKPTDINRKGNQMEDQPEPGLGLGPHGYVRRQFSNGGYRGWFRRFLDGNMNRDFRDGNGNRDFRGDGIGNRDFRGDGNGNHNSRGVDCSFPLGGANEYPSRMHNNQMNGWRERSSSPPVFRRLHDPQSRSRSRSRSPVSWNRRNRSPPGFRADENRMERVRLPFQKRFLLDQETGFMPPQRNQRNSRFFDSRNNDGGGENHHNNMRERRSPPGRMFKQEQRFDNMRRVNSENNFRPFVRHNTNNRRFGDGGGGRGGGGCKYEGAEEEKNVNMYEMVHQPPPLLRVEAMEEDSDNIRRFRLDAEQQHTVVSNDNNKEDVSLTNKM